MINLRTTSNSSKIVVHTTRRDGRRKRQSREEKETNRVVPDLKQWEADERQCVRTRHDNECLASKVNK